MPTKTPSLAILNDADLEALSVTRSEDLAPDDLPPRLPLRPPKPEKRARVPKRVRKLVGTPTKEQIAEFLATTDKEKHGPDPQTIIAARIMFLNGSRPRAICSALSLHQKWLKPYWAAWVAEKKEYQERVQGDAWAIGRGMLEHALTSIIEQDLGIGGKLRDLLKKTLENVSTSIAAGEQPSAKELETLAKVFKTTADVTHKMVGLGQQTKVQATQNNSFNFPPGIGAGAAKPIDVPSRIHPTPRA
jgi:hypothetical protein